MYGYTRLIGLKARQDDRVVPEGDVEEKGDGPLMKRGKTPSYCKYETLRRVKKRNFGGDVCPIECKEMV